jgi:isopropylmalate/homocitrate/citramalate synthase
MAEAKTHGLQVRAYVSDAFQSSDGLKTDPATVQDTVVALADADAYSITISDDNETSETDSLR